MVDDIEFRVLKWYDDNHNAKMFFAKSKPDVNLNVSISTGKHAWLWEDGAEIMDDYFSTFNVEIADFNFLKYWPNEKSMIPNFLLPKALRVDRNIAPEPLTLGMLAESAKSGRWLYG